MVKSLIINADDFGISPATNRAVQELIKACKITSASLLANGEFAEEAMEIARSNNFKTGVHLTLNSDFAERPWRSLSATASLSDADGNLLSDITLLSKRAISREVSAECIAQIERIIESGVEIDHLDNHSGTMYGINGRLFFFNAFRIARRYSLPFRFPKQNGFLKCYFKSGIPPAIKAAHKVVAGIARIMKVNLIDNLITNPYKVSDISNYSELEKYYLDALRVLPDGITEMFLHPSYSCPIFSPLSNEWKKREWELEFLHSEPLRAFLDNENIKVVSYQSVK